MGHYSIYILLNFTLHPKYCIKTLWGLKGGEKGETQVGGGGKDSSKDVAITV